MTTPSPCTLARNATRSDRGRGCGSCAAPGRPVARRRAGIRDGAGATLLAAGVALAVLPAAGASFAFGANALLFLLLGTGLLMPRIVRIVQMGVRPWVGRLLGLTGQLANENVARDLPRAAVIGAVSDGLTGAPCGTTRRASP